MRIYSVLFKRLALALVAALAFAVPTFVAAPQASAATDAPTSERARNYFGSISISSDGAAGVAYDYRTKSGALRAAYRKCRVYSNYPGTCRKVVWVRNGCAAVSVKRDANGWVTRYKWGVAYSKRAAVRKSHTNFGGKLIAWTCTTRR